MPPEDPRPQDPRLDPYRDAVWELSRNGTVEAHLVTQVSHFRYWPFGRKYHESLVCRLYWLDGHSEPPEEDYEPWVSVPELEQGKYESSYADGMFDAKPLEGSARDHIWDRYGRP